MSTVKYSFPPHPFKVANLLVGAGVLELQLMYGEQRSVPLGELAAVEKGCGFPDKAPPLPQLQLQISRNLPPHRWQS